MANSRLAIYPPWRARNSQLATSLLQTRDFVALLDSLPGGAILNGEEWEQAAAGKEYVKQGFDVNAKYADADSQSLLHREIHVCQVEVVKVLVDAGADVDAATDDGHSPLHWVMMHVSREDEAALKMSQILLKTGAKINPKSDLGYTPLDIAIMNTKGSSDRRVVDFLIKRGAKTGKGLKVKEKTE